MGEGVEGGKDEHGTALLGGWKYVLYKPFPRCFSAFPSFCHPAYTTCDNTQYLLYLELDNVKNKLLAVIVIGALFYL
jgi:hypothetical protein